MNWNVYHFRVEDAPTRPVAIIERDGLASIERVRLTIGNQGLYGCSTCEQVHRLPMAECPLIGKAVHRVRLGPYLTPTGSLTLLVTEAAIAAVTGETA